MTIKDVNQLDDAWRTLEKLDVSSLPLVEQEFLLDVRGSIGACMEAEQNRRDPVDPVELGRNLASGRLYALADWGRGPSTPRQADLAVIRTFVDTYRDSNSASAIHAELCKLAQASVFTKLTSDLTTADQEGITERPIGSSSAHKRIKSIVIDDSRGR